MISTAAMARPGFRGGGGGFIIGYMTPDLGPINDEISLLSSTSNQISGFDDGMVMFGGQGLWLCQP